MIIRYYILLSIFYRIYFHRRLHRGCSKKKFLHVKIWSKYWENGHSLRNIPTKNLSKALVVWMRIHLYLRGLNRGTNRRMKHLLQIVPPVYRISSLIISLIIHFFSHIVHRFQFFCFRKKIFFRGIQFLW